MKKVFGLDLTQVLEMLAILKRDHKIPPFKEGRGGGHNKLCPDLKGGGVHKGFRPMIFQFYTPKPHN